MGITKYEALGVEYPYKDKKEMDKELCNKLYNKFMDMYNKEI